MAADWSVSETAVLASVRELLDAEERGVLATVIRVEGSAYRRPGAKMVVRPDGEGIGNITAGCLEDEVQRIAEEVLDAGEPRVETYDLMEGDDDVWGLGVGCNGVISVLVEPIDEGYRPAVDAAERNESVGVLTAVDSEDGDVPAGTRGFVHPDGVVEGDLPAWVTDKLADAAADLAREGKSDTVTVTGPRGDVEVFVDGLVARPDLVVVGTGPDVVPVVEAGALNDFRVTVVGYRGANATPERFPAADEVVATSPPKIAEAVDVDENTAVVVMTHNFVDDRLTVEALSGTDAQYVGLLGPRERFEEMQEAFADEGTTLPEEFLDRLYTPAGLDLGGGAPAQIATSIVAEVLAVVNGREPRHLKEREGPIHDRADLDALATD